MEVQQAESNGGAARRLMCSVYRCLDFKVVQNDANNAGNDSCCSTHVEHAQKETVTVMDVSKCANNAAVHMFLTCPAPKRDLYMLMIAYG